MFNETDIKNLKKALRHWESTRRYGTEDINFDLIQLWNKLEAMEKKVNKNYDEPYEDTGFTD